MKKIALACFLFLSLIATDASATTTYSYGKQGQLKNNLGKWYNYDYLISTSESFFQSSLESIGDLLTGLYLNLPLLADSGNFSTNHLGTTYYLMSYNLVTPLPAALPMFAAAIVGVGFYRRRKTV